MEEKVCVCVYVKERERDNAKWREANWQPIENDTHLALTDKLEADDSKFGFWRSAVSV